MIAAMIRIATMSAVRTEAAIAMMVTMSNPFPGLFPGLPQFLEE